MLTMARNEYDKESPLWFEGGSDPILPYAREILSVKDEGKIGFLVCDAQPSVYSNGVILEALRHVSRARGVKVVALSSEDAETPGLESLASEDVIQLLKSRSRLFTPHFLVIEGFFNLDFMLEEQMHEPGIPAGQVRELNKDWGRERYRDTYQRWKERIEVNKRGFDEICRNLGGDAHFNP